MFKGKREILAQLLAFTITASLLTYVSRTTFGLVIALILGLLAMIITHLTIRGETPLVCIKIRLLHKIGTYNLLAILYAVLLILLLSAHILGVVPHSLIFFQEWGAIPIQNYILLLASMGATFFLPGYFILQVINRDCSISGLDALVFSFLLSYLYTPFMGLISLSLLGEISTVFYLSFSLLFLTICIFISRMFFKNIDRKKEDSTVRVHPMLLITITVFFVATLAFSKDYGYIGGDVWRHQGTAISIIRYGLQAVKIPLNWLHVGLVYVFTLPGFPIVNSASALNLLNIMPILAFYCMARKVFGEKSQVMSTIATIFFSIFSGFGWTYALYRMQFESWTDALARTASITANDTLFSNLWIWGHNPFIVGFTAFFMLSYLLFCTIKRESAVFTLTLLTFLTGWILHASEAFIFVIMFGIILLFCQSVNHSRKLSVCLALIVGLLTTLIAIQLSPGVVFFTTGFWESALLLVYLTIATLMMFTSQKLLDSFKRVIKHIKHSRTVHISISTLILFLWLLSFYLWVQEEPTLWDLRSISTDIGFVPWYTYPMRLGIVGFFALLALLLKGNICSFSMEKSRHFTTFTVLAGGLFVFGKIITITKIYYLSVGYWEIRILRYFLHAVVAVIATMFALYLFDFIRYRIHVAQTKKSALSLRLLTAIFLALVIVVGTMSTVFTVDHWANQPRRPVRKDLGIATFALDENTPFTDQSAMFVGITSSSVDLLNRLGVGVKCVSNPMRDTITLTSSAETYYFGTWFTEANYLLYVPEFDDYTLKSNRDSFIYTNVLQVFDPAYKINETSIYRLPYGVPPTPNSEVLLLLPTGLPYTSVLNAFAQTNRSYDVALPDALTNLHHPTIVLPYDPLDIELSHKLIKRVEEGITLVVFNVDKLGNIAEKLNLTRKDKIASVEPVTSWRIGIGEGLINSITQNEQTIMNITGQTNIDGIVRVDYILEDPWDLKDAEALAFNFKSNKAIQSVRFAFFDASNNYRAYTLEYVTVGEWQDFRLDPDAFTEASPSLNLSSVSKIRIGINGDPNSVYNFYFSDIEVISKPHDVSANSIAYKQQTYTLSSTIDVPTLNQNNAIAFYIFNGTKVSPLIIHEKYGMGEIFYINALPLIENEKSSIETLSEIITWIQDAAGLPPFNWTRDDANGHFEMYTKKVVARGSITVDSNSLAFISGFQINLNTVYYSNIYFSIKAADVEISPGIEGAYSHLSVSSPFELHVFKDEEQLAKYNVRENSTFLVKDLQVTIHGEAQLEETYWRKKAGHWGRTLIFEGDTSFTIHYTNAYLFLFNFQHKGSFRSFIPHLDFVKLYPKLEHASTTFYLSIIIIVVIVALKKLDKAKINTKLLKH